MWLSAERRVGLPTMDGPTMVAKNIVLQSINLEGDARCVDIFERPDGTFGFEEYRRDHEDGRGWFAIGGYSKRSFAIASEAHEAARCAIKWLATTSQR